MGKRINLAEIKARNEKVAEHKLLTVKIGDENYDVKIDTSFRYKKVIEIFNWVGENEKVLSILDDEKVLSVLIIIKFLTDVDLGEDMDQALLGIAELSEAGVMADIVNAVPMELLEKYIAELLKMTKEVELGSKKLKQLIK